MLPKIGAALNLPESFVVHTPYSNRHKIRSAIPASVTVRRIARGSKGVFGSVCIVHTDRGQSSAAMDALIQAGYTVTRFA